MQQPTADAIKEQVSREVDEQLPKKVVESALKNSSNKKQKEKGSHTPSLNLRKEFMLKAVPIKYLLWKEHVPIQV